MTPVVRLTRSCSQGWHIRAMECLRDSFFQATCSFAPRYLSPVLPSPLASTLLELEGGRPSLYQKNESSVHVKGPLPCCQKEHLAQENRTSGVAQGFYACLWLVASAESICTCMTCPAGQEYAHIEQAATLHDRRGLSTIQGVSNHGNS